MVREREESESVDGWFVTVVFGNQRYVHDT